MTNGNPTQTIVIVVDDSAVAAANARTKKAFADQAQSGVSSYKQIGAASSNTTDIIISDTNRQISAHQRNIQVITQVAQAHRNLHALIQTTLRLSELATGAATTAVAAGPTIETGVNLYRAARFALSPTPFTAATIVGGIALERSFSAAAQQGTFLNQQGYVAARGGYNYQDAQRLAQAAQFSGQKSDFYQNMYSDLRQSAQTSSGQAALSGLGFSGIKTPTVQDLQAIGVALNGIVDPAQRANAAIALFPHTAGAALQSLGRDFEYTNNSIDRFNTLLSADAAANIQEFRGKLDDVKGGLREVGQFFDAIAQKGKNFLADVGATVGNYLLDVAHSPVQALKDLDFTITGKENAETRNSIRQLPGFVQAQNDFVNRRSSQLSAQAAASAIAPDVDRIATASYDSDTARAGRADAARERRSGAIAQYMREKTLGLPHDPQNMILINSLSREISAFAKPDEVDTKGAETAADDFRRRSVEAELTGVARVNATRDEMLEKYGKSPAARADIQTGIDALMRRARFQEAQEWNNFNFDETKGYAERSLNFSRTVGGLNLAQGSYGLETIELQRQLGITQNAFGIDQAGYARDAALRNLALHPVGDSEDVMAQAAIQRTYLLNTSQIRGGALSTAQQKELDDLDQALKTSQISQGNYDSRKSYILGNYGEQQKELAAGTNAGMADINGQAAITLANQSKDRIQKDFEAVKDAAGQVLDSLFDRGSNVFKSLANVLKNALFNAIKEGLSNQIAGAFTNALHGPGAVSFESAQGGGGLLGMLGLPASPKFSAIGGVPSGGSGGDPGVQIVRDSQGGDNSWSGSSGGALAGIPGFPVGAVNMLAAMNPMAAIGGTQDLGGGTVGSSSTGMIGGYGGGSASTGGTYGVSVDGSAGGASTSGVAGVAAARDAVFGSTVSGTATGHGSGGLLSSVTGGKGGIVSRISQLKSLFYNSGSIQLSNGVATTAAGVSQAAGGGVLGSIAGGAAGFVSSPGAASLGLSLGLSGLEAKRQNLGTSIKTVGGFGLSGASLGAQGILPGGMAGGAIIGAGVGLTADGIKRGGFTGLAEDAAGGAAVGFEFGGPFGAAIGAVAGAAVGVARLFITTDLQHTIKLAQQLYHLTISQDIASQIDQIAKQSFGGQISVAMRSKPVLDLLTLYAQATGQKFGVQNVERPYFLTETTKGVQQQAFYVDGSAYSYNSPLSVYGGVATTALNPYIQGNQTVKLPGQGNYANVPTSSPQSFQLDGDSTQAFLSGQAVQFVNGNPRVITDANQDAQNGGYGRLSSAALLLSPTLLT